MAEETILQQTIPGHGSLPRLPGEMIYQGEQASQELQQRAIQERDNLLQEVKDIQTKFPELKITGVEDLQNLSKDKQQQVQQDVAAYQQTEIPKTAAKVEQFLCPRCHWLSTPKKIDLTVEEKFTFVQALLDNQPYQQSYRFLQDKLAITLRTLTITEDDLVLETLQQLQQNNQLANTQEFWRCYWDYRFCLALVSYTVDHKTYKPIANYSDLASSLAALKTSPGLQQELVWRLVTATYRDTFQARLDELEKQALQENF